MFADSAKIYVKSGSGGNGHVSFRRELFVAAGGPDGGDGGDGGDVIFEVDKNINTLNEFRFVRKYYAKDGDEGGRRRCHGKDGDDIIIKVPEGTVVKEAESGKVIVDMSGENQRKVILKGGKGGKGNMNYATPTMQVPTYAQPGKPGIELTLILELKLIADVGLVGYPNVGKSTILSRCTNAKPKIANYHFTTLHPNLGVVDLGGGAGFVIADIPGLIEGASEGVGLGHQFLRHIERTRIIVHVVDISGSEGRDPIEDIKNINKELENYNPELLKTPQIIAANKMDLFYGDEADEKLKEFHEAFDGENIPIYPISAVSGKGIKELLYAVNDILKTLNREPLVFNEEFDTSDLVIEESPLEITKVKEGEFLVKGSKIDKMLGYTNLEDEKGFAFFQKFLRDQGIIDRLEELGIEEGDLVNLGDLSFDYYR